MLLSLFYLFLTLCPDPSVASEMPCTTSPCKEWTVQEGLHTSWDRLLKKYVQDDGLVDYTGFIKDEDKLDHYLQDLADHAPEEDSGRNEKLAYYINLYNAATVKLILDHYPVESIRDIQKPWAREWISVGDRQISLNDIEHKILRKMGEPRIHFAINCASVSCPKLLNTAFTAEQLEKQLEQATGDFMRDPSRNRITASSVELSQIFKWYREDFTTEGSLLFYIAPYSGINPDPDLKVKFLKYDWHLNEAR